MFLSQSLIVKKFLINSIVFILVLLCFLRGAKVLAGENSGRTFYMTDILLASPINPLFTTSTISASLLDILYDPLIEYTSADEIKSALAKTWQVSNDGLEWIFDLRHNVIFHDGSKFTAHDVKATYEKLFSIKGSFYTYGFSNVENIDVVSDFKIRIKLKRYDAFFPLFVHLVHIIPAHIAGSKETKMPVIGTGAFRLIHFSPKHIELAANEDYFRGRPRLDKIVVDIYPNQRSCLSMLIAERADMVFLTDIKDYEVFSDVKGMYIASYPVEFTYWMFFNLNDPVLKDKSVRQYLNYAVNKARMKEFNKLGQSDKASLFNIPYDPKKALSIMRDRLKRKNVELVLGISESDEVSKQIAQFLQDDFENIGMSLKFEVFPSLGELASKGVVKRNFQSMLLPMNMRSGMPQHYLFWHSSQIKKGGNFSGYNNSEVDRLLDEIRYNPDPEKRKIAREHLAKAFEDDPPGIPLFVKRVPALVNSKFVGFSQDPFSFFSSLRSVKIKDDK